MGPIFSNRYVDALAKTIVVFGAIHILILITIAVRGEIDALNAFWILDLQTFIPALQHGLINFILSYCLVLAAYLLVYRYFTKPKSK